MKKDNNFKPTDGLFAQVQKRGIVFKPMSIKEMNKKLKLNIKCQKK